MLQEFKIGDLVRVKDEKALIRSSNYCDKKYLKLKGEIIHKYKYENNGQDIYVVNFPFPLDERDLFFNELLIYTKRLSNHPFTNIFLPDNNYLKDKDVIKKNNKKIRQKLDIPKIDGINDLNAIFGFDNNRPAPLGKNLLKGFNLDKF